jgi:hypothetical protein
MNTVTRRALGKILTIIIFFNPESQIKAESDVAM